MALVPRGASGTDVPAYAAAARAQELDGLPPTLLLVGDPTGSSTRTSLRHRLTHAGVPTEVHVYPAAPHGFDLVAPEAATSVAATADAERWLAGVWGAGMTTGTGDGAVAGCARPARTT